MLWAQPKLNCLDNITSGLYTEAETFLIILQFSGFFPISQNILVYTSFPVILQSHIRAYIILPPDQVQLLWRTVIGSQCLLPFLSFLFSCFLYCNKRSSFNWESCWSPVFFRHLLNREPPLTFHCGLGTLQVFLRCFWSPFFGLDFHYDLITSPFSKTDAIDHKKNRIKGKYI